MAKQSAILNDEDILNEGFTESFDFDELEEKLQGQLEEEFSNLEFLKEEKEKIGNPDALGKVILDEVWKQFSNQIGLDMTNETLNQKYDREHKGETYEDVGKKVMQDPKYKEAKENKNKPFSTKVAQVGKIITAGLVAGGAIFLGELFEKLLLSVPGMQIEIPLLGTLANVIGLFLASLVSGLVGAIIINLIDKFIAKKQKSDAQAVAIEKRNQIIDKQHEIQIVNEALLERDKENAQSNIKGRRQEAAIIMKDAYGNIMEDFVEDLSENVHTSIIDEEDVITIRESDKASNELDDLMR